MKPQTLKRLAARLPSLASRNPRAEGAGHLLTWVVDALAITIGFTAAVALREWLRQEGHTRGEDLDIMYRHFLSALAYYLVGLYILFHYVEAFRDTRWLSPNREAFRILKALFAFTLFNSVLGFLLPEQLLFSRLTLWMSLVLSAALIFLGRWALAAARERLWREGVDLRVALLAGGGPQAQLLAMELEQSARHGYRLAGILSARGDLRRVGRARILGGVERLDRVVRRLPVDEVILCEPHWNAAQVMQFFETLRPRGVRIRLASHLFEVVVERVKAPVDSLGSLPILDFGTAETPVWKRRVKRAADLLLGGLLLLFATPLLLAIALAVRLSSPGPVLHVQERVGAGGRLFRFYKFRTMIANAEALQENLNGNNEIGGAMFKMRRDPRVTPIGRFLRRHSLDELPQLWNVLKGDMSLVGPRPPLPFEVERYEPWHRQRLEGPMGLSGLWQVSGRNELSFDEAALLDIYYLRNYSLFFDCRILIRTLFTILAGQGW